MTKNQLKKIVLNTSAWGCLILANLNQESFMKAAFTFTAIVCFLGYWFGKED